MSCHQALEGRLANNRLYWDTPRIRGHAWTSADAPTSLFLRFSRMDMPDIEIFEMIQLTPAADVRMRTWHWLKGGQPIRRTLVDEVRVGP